MTASAAGIVAAMLVQAALAYGLLLRLGSVRLPLVSTGQIRIADVALSRDPWPDAAKQASNAFDNQFQLPVLFYVSAGLALYLGPSLLELVLVWLFVLSRLVHAFIHATSNHVVRRFAAYTFGFVMLCALWIDLVVRLALLVIWPAIA